MKRSPHKLWLDEAGSPQGLKPALNRMVIAPEALRHRNQARDLIFRDANSGLPGTAYGAVPVPLRP